MENKKKSLLSQMAPYLKGYKALFGLAVIFTIVSSTITVIGPDRLKEMTDTMTKGLAGKIDLDKIGEIALTLALLYFAGALVSYTASFIVSTLIQKFSQRLRNAIADKIN